MNSLMMMLVPRRSRNVGLVLGVSPIILCTYPYFRTVDEGATKYIELSDVFHERRAELITEHGDEIGEILAEDPEQYQFFVPLEARWEEIRKNAQDEFLTVLNDWNVSQPYKC